MKSMVRDICRRKREARIEPVLATVLELKQELSRRGVPYTAESFVRMRQALERDPDVVIRRLRNFNGYELKR